MFSSIPFRRGPVSLVCLALASPWAVAQTTPALAERTPNVVITGNPLGNAPGAAPTSVLAGEALVLRRGSTLGETLDGLPGVSATAFGPNASRPVIRGLDGDRIRILNNSGATLDASSLSFDHAVPLDPLVATRIEVLRGPAALFYGGNAIGGVINVLDNRIPEDRRLNGTSGAAELRGGGAASELGGALTVDWGRAGAFALHVDAFGRDAQNQKSPRYTPVTDGATLDPTREVRNSASNSHGGALGGSIFFDGGRIGMAVDTYSNRYGVVAEPDVTIAMQRDQWRLAAVLDRGPGPLRDVLRDVHLDLSATDYVHREIEGDGAVGTTFKSRGGDLRLQARHADWRAGQSKGSGVVGVQIENSDFSALGEEAFVPETRTRRAGAFALEELAWGGGSTSLGLRLEQSRVSSEGDADPTEDRFGKASQRRFTLHSLSLGHVLDLSRTWRLSASLSQSQRAPTFFELYANGVHAATAAYELGDKTLGKEQGRHLELAAAWRQGNDHLRVGAFQTRFSRYIGLDDAGVQVDESGQVVPDGTPDAVPLFRFQSARALLKGVEIDGAKRLLDGRWQLDATGKFDLTRGTNTDRNEPLPRLPGWRLGLGLDASTGPWTTRVEVTRVARQARVSEGDTATAGYTLVNLSLRLRFNLGTSDAVAFAKLGNVTNELAYNASAIQTIRGLSPLAGRALLAGVRVAF
jgi:iron complex outermembrane recepter protein